MSYTLIHSMYCEKKFDLKIKFLFVCLDFISFCIVGFRIFLWLGIRFVLCWLFSSVDLGVAFIVNLIVVTLVLSLVRKGLGRKITTWATLWKNDKNLVSQKSLSCEAFVFWNLFEFERLMGLFLPNKTIIYSRFKKYLVEH